MISLWASGATFRSLHYEGLVRIFEDRVKGVGRVCLMSTLRGFVRFFEDYVKGGW